MELLRRKGFRPRTVVDIGVATGTPWLYKAFPDAQLVLIDPSPAAAPSLARIARETGAHVFPHALGAERGEVVLNVDSVAPSSSSLLPVSSMLKLKWADSGVRRDFRAVPVPMLTLDETLASRAYEEPMLIKIDTEGYEQQILLGATDTLRRAEVVVAEVSVAKRFEGSYEFSELIALMADRGFRLFDLLDVTTLGRGGPINFLDAAFVRRDSALLDA
jgi:FkbM family methyltransferase